MCAKRVKFKTMRAIDQAWNRQASAAFSAHGNGGTVMLERLRQFEGADQIGLFGPRQAPLVEFTPLLAWLRNMLR